MSHSPSDPLKDPKAIRALVEKQRRALPNEEAGAIAHRIVERWVTALEVRSTSFAGVRIALYRPLPGELALFELESRLRLAGARVYFPRVTDSAAKVLEFAEVPTDSMVHWIAGPYGIQEPDARLPLAAPEDLDLIIVPGVAFSENLERIGRGAGYYDRYLARATRALRVALCLDLQLFPRIPQKEWDQKVDWVLTENRDIRGAQALRWLSSGASPA